MCFPLTVSGCFSCCFPLTASGCVSCVFPSLFQDVFADKLNPMELTVTFFQSEVPYDRPTPGEPLPDINTYPILSTEGIAAGTKANTVSTFVSTCQVYGSFLATGFD